MLEDYQDLIDELLGTPALVRTLFANSEGGPSEKTVVAVSALHERDKTVLDRLQRLMRESAPPWFKILPGWIKRLPPLRFPPIWTPS